jgi:hypothetical protein
MRFLLFLGLIVGSLGSAPIGEEETAEAVVDALQGAVDGRRNGRRRSQSHTR